jgi:hypothetical protein
MIVLIEIWDENKSHSTIFFFKIQKRKIGNNFFYENFREKLELRLEIVISLEDIYLVIYFPSPLNQKMEFLKSSTYRQSP